MRFNIKTSLSLLPVFISLTGCVTPGKDNRPDVYMANQVNQRQFSSVVTILAISPIQVKVNNEKNRRAAQIIGGIAGAAIGAGLGTEFGGSALLGGLGGLGGAGLGVATGSLVRNTTFVDGVSITYEQGNHTYSSAQIGHRCEYKLGKAIMIQSTPTETRIQPNSTCE